MNARDIADLYRRYAPAIYAHCRKLLGSPSAARDAMHESFVRVMQHNRSIGPQDQALRYLYRTSTNLCINLLRQQSVRDRAAPEIGSRARSAEALGSQASPVDRQFVQRLLDRCDDTATAVAVMHMVDGLSQVEVAAALGISRRTVFNRIRQIERIAADLMESPALSRVQRAAGGARAATSA